MKPGTKVVLAGAPHVEGTILRLCGRRARVAWSEHFCSTVDARRLIALKKPNAPPVKQLAELRSKERITDHE